MINFINIVLFKLKFGHLLNIWYILYCLNDHTLLDYEELKKKKKIINELKIFYHQFFFK